MTTPRWPLTTAALGGALAVGLGAFGAHLLPRLLDALSEDDLRSALAWWSTASTYHLYHSLALAAWSVWRERRSGVSNAPAFLWIAGVAFFSGSLYVMALTQQRWLGAITPVGGVMFIAAWMTWAAQAARRT